MNTATLDAQHLLCPLPVIRVQERIETLATGTELTVLCTDPGTLYDIPAWCRVHGHQILSSDQQNELITIVVKVS